MIANNEESEPHEPRDGTGGLGGDYGLTPLKETRLEARAIRKRWPTKKKHRKRIVERLAKIASNTDSERHAIAAGRAYMEAEKQNQADQPSRHLHLHADVEELPTDDLKRELKQIIVEEGKNSEGATAPSGSNGEDH